MISCSRAALPLTLVVASVLFSTSAAAASAQKPAAAASAQKPAAPATPRAERVGVADDPSKWAVAGNSEFLTTALEMQRTARAQAGEVAAVGKRVRDALAETRRNPTSDAHRQALLATALQAIDTVQSTLQKVRMHEVALDAAYAQDLDRLIRIGKQRADATERSAADLQLAKAQLQQTTGQIEEKLRDGADDESLEELWLAELRLRGEIDYHEMLASNGSSRDRMLAQAIDNMRQARRSTKECFLRLAAYSKRLSAATQTLEVIAESQETRRIGDELRALSDAARGLIGDGELEASMQQVIALLTGAETSGEQAGRSGPPSTFEAWKQQWRARVAPAGLTSRNENDAKAGIRR